MQTFLPLPNFRQTAKVLDNKRLGKQRVETLQIYNNLVGKKTRWYNHPAVQMWKVYENVLLQYGVLICREWQQRGFNDTLHNKFNDILVSKIPVEFVYPEWYGNEKFHSRHRSRLLFKGRCDAICSSIQKHLKIRGINKWLKANGYNLKYALTYDEMLSLENKANDLGGVLFPNHYKQFGWTESDKLGYLWPSKGEI